MTVNAKPGFYHDDDDDLHVSETHYGKGRGGYYGGYAVVQPGNSCNFLAWKCNFKYFYVVYVVPVYVKPYGGQSYGGYGGRGRKGYNKGYKRGYHGWH